MTGTQIALLVIVCYGLIALIVGPILRRKQQHEIDATLRAHDEFMRRSAKIEASDVRLK